jgi:hypothetical protein
MKKLRRKEFLDEARVDFAIAIEQTISFNPGATAVVLFRNQQMDSSSFGQQTIMVVGPECTYKSVEEVDGKWLNDAPSQRQHAIAWCDAAEFRPEGGKKG